MKRAGLQARQLFVSRLEDFPTCCGFSADGHWLAIGTGNGHIHLIDCNTGTLAARWQAHNTPVQDLAWHPQEPLLASGDQQAQCKLWRADMAADDGTPLLQHSLPAAADWIQQLAWRPGGDFLAIAAGKQVDVFNRNGNAISRIPFETGSVAGICWHPRGTELAVAGYQGIKLVTGAIYKTPRAQWLRWQGSLLNCSFSPDGKVVAAACQDNAVHFWRIKNGKDAAMSGYAAKPRALTWSPDSKWLLTGGSSEVVGWNFSGGGPEGSPPLLMDYHRNTVTHLALNPRTRWLASGCKQHDVALWHAITDALPAYVFSMEAPLAGLRWCNTTGRSLLAAVDESGYAGLWAIEEVQ